MCQRIQYPLVADTASIPQRSIAVVAGRSWPQECIGTSGVAICWYAGCVVVILIVVYFSVRGMWRIGCGDTVRRGTGMY